MLGVAVLLASSSMAAIELITLYARMDNAVHKMAPPFLPPLPLASHLSLQKRLLLKNSLVLSPVCFLYEGMLLLCGAAGVEVMQMKV